MATSFTLSSPQSFLASFRLPPVTAPEEVRLPAAVKDVLPAIMQRDTDPRSRSMRMILGDHGALPDEEQAALHLALATSFYQAGDYRKARRHAEQSASFYGRQWGAHRLIVDTYMAQQAFEDALAQIESFLPPTKTPAWDRPLTVRDWKLCGAACAWRIKSWEEVARYVDEAFPEGFSTMPAGLLEDYFRLTLYLNRPDEAARVAAILMPTHTLEFNDALLQTLVQQGWTEQALPLYRHAFDQDPRNQLLRRRLVALCIREGKIEEARRLTAPGALDLNARANS